MTGESVRRPAPAVADTLSPNRLLRQRPRSLRRTRFAQRPIEREEMSMLVNKAAGREWKPTEYPGVDRSL